MKTVHCRMPDKNLAALDQTCARLQMTRSDVIRRALHVALPVFDRITLPTSEDNERQQQLQNAPREV